MSSIIVSVLNLVVLAGIAVSAIMAVRFEKLLSSVLALGVTGSLMALEFIILQAPDVAIAEAAVGAVLSTVIFLVTLKKVKEEKEK